MNTKVEKYVSYLKFCIFNAVLKTGGFEILKHEI